jgi:hypothetical protein
MLNAATERCRHENDPQITQQIGADLKDKKSVDKTIS